MVENTRYRLEYYKAMALQSILALGITALASIATKGLLVKVGEYEFELKKK